MNALQIIGAQGVVAIVRSATPEEAATAVATLLDAGLRAVEVSLVTPGALDVVRDAAAHAPQDAVIGVGTVLTVAQAKASADAGARFIVSPAFDRGVVAEAAALGMLVLPGVATPTEAVDAAAAGAPAVKLFPASLWRPDVLREVRTALPWLQVVPTGGVSLTSAPEWIRAGALAVGVGSTLTRAENPGVTVRALLDAIAAARAAGTS
ncbi:bifunctional 4-hydroxy-2-oxoglutarate aldolase/2-dehydro-3-deoxy-phosphogluconate aldolase [Microbacterium sp. P5_E9]